ncbi:MAG: 2-oxo acid dehydrogenase subunit E2 [Treponema sp.]|nr:2-oxo acid dehydrogenase subunit E2 [Treponema sp.]
MAERIILPKQGLQMTEGTITEWCVAEGGEVIRGQPLFIMETDKTTLTVDAGVSGTLLKIFAPADTVVPVARIVAVVGKPGEDISAFLAEAASAGAAAETGTVSPRALPAAAKPRGRVLISPRAKMRARELGIDYSAIQGSSPDGMIVEKDVLAARSKAPRASPLAKKTAELSGTDISKISGAGARGKIMRDDVIRSVRNTGARRTIVPLGGMRKIISEKMKRSLNENAQACHRVSVRMDEAVRLRISLEKTVGFNDLIALAAIRALRDFPAVNAELTPEGIWQKDFVNLGVAVAVDKGLIVPVVKDADLLSLRELAAAIKAMVEKARNGALEPDDYTGGSFTLSNLGMYGLEEFVAIINPPEAGILAVGRIEDTPVAVAGALAIHPVMKLTLSYDHRIVDGAPAAQFLYRIKEYLENPFRML